MLIPDLPPAFSAPPQTVLIAERVPGIAADPNRFNTPVLLAQSIIPAADGTGTLVGPDGNRYDIDGGSFSSNGTNQFHSFEQFNLNANEIANFLTNPQTQNILTRVVGGNASLLNGLIQVTGGNANLFLMNPAGIVFGNDASLNVSGSFAATTASGIGFEGGWFNASGSNNYSLLNGSPNRFVFTSTQPGSILNAGNLAVDPEKTIALLGGTVVNTGNLSAPGGNITIAAIPGETLVRISQEGMALSLEVEPQTNSGEQNAEDVVHPLSFNPVALPELLTQANLGHATAVTVNTDGSLRLTGSGIAIPSETGTAIISGTLNSSTQNSKLKTQNSVTAGSINVLGDRVALFSAQLDASGAEGGGTVRIGGDFQGRGPFFRATQTIVSEDSSILVDALEQGNGGQAIVWADRLTRFYGNISARGGASKGDGGLVEVSGKELLVFTGHVDASAPAGNSGTVLLDPKNITISDRNSPLATFLNPVPNGGDRFGFAIAAVGTNILIGAPFDDSSGMMDAGAAYLFDGSSGALLQSFFDPTPTVDAEFGTAVAGVGTNILVGAPGKFLDEGIAYLFDSSGSLLQTFMNPESGGVGEFGTAVAAFGTNALVGAPGNNGGAGLAYLMDSNTGGMLQTFNNPTPVAGDEFGAAIAATGANVLIGEPGENSGTGAAHLFNGNTGGLLQTFKNPTPSAGDEFGRSVAAVENNPLIGAPFDNTSASNAGAAYLFDSNSGGLLQTYLSPNPSNGGQFGISVAAVDGNILVGAPFEAGAGAAYLFDGSTGGLRQSFTNPTGATGNRFGVAVAGAGTNALVGASFEDLGATNTGAAFSFPTRFSFSDNPDQSVTIDVSTLTNIANTGTAIVLQASNDITVESALTTNNPTGNGGSLTFQAGRNLSINADITTDDGNLTLIANETAANGTFSAFRDPGHAAISTAAGVTLNAGIGSLTATLNTGAGLTHNSSGNIALGDLVAGSVQGQNNGPSGGNLSAGNITTNGGAINLSAPGGITTGQLNSSSSSSNGGNVALNATGGDIQVSSINAQGGTGGTGGTVQIATQGFVRMTNTFVALNNVAASISTAGGVGGGAITIQHGGQGTTPFTVGDASINGTAGAITSGEFTLSPLQSFPFTHTEGNIQITSVDQPFNSVDLDRSLIFSELQGSEPLPLLEIDILQELEEVFTEAFETYLGLDETSIKSLSDARHTLRRIEQETGVKPALIYAFFVPQAIAPQPPTAENKSLSSSPTELNPGKADASLAQGTSVTGGSVLSQPGAIAQENDRLELVLITAEGSVIRKQVVGASREIVLKKAKQLLGEVTDRRKLRRKSYLAPAQQMYQWLLAPLEEELQMREIDNLVFILDSGLRSVPLAAMHDGQGFVVERYSVGLMPSLSLTDTRYVNVKNMQVLAMGAEEFLDQDSLLAVPAELDAIANRLWQGKSLRDDDFTLRNLQRHRKTRPIGILHLATHAIFQPGAAQNSHIYFHQERVSFKQLRQIVAGRSPIELLVLSACRTALGDREAELGFAGLAVQAGVKAALGSLWYVSDEGTFGLMASFYENLRTAPIKAEGLQNAQQAMLRGEVYLQDGHLVTQNGRFPLPESLAGLRNQNFAHPYYWSGFAMIGNPW